MASGKTDEGLKPQPGDPYFLGHEQGVHHSLFPGVEIRTLAGDRLMLSVVTFEPDSVVPEHSHPHEQMGIMISGRLEFSVGGLTRILGPGDQWRIPGDTPHRVVAIDGPAVALDVFHPVRDDYR